MPRIESGFNAMQDQILFAILQGNANLLTQLTQSQLGKVAFMRVYKDNFWFMDNDPTAMQAIASSALAMNILLKSSTSIKAILRSSSIAVNAILNNIATLQNTQYFSYSSQQQTYIGNGTSTYTIPANSLIRITNLYSYDYYPSDAGASGTVTLTDGINSSQIGSYNMNGDGSTTTNIDVNLLCFGNLINTRNVSGSHPSEFRLRITFTVYTAL